MKTTSPLAQAQSAARQALLKKSGDREGAMKAALLVMKDQLPLATKKVQLEYAQEAVALVW